MHAAYLPFQCPPQGGAGQEGGGGGSRKQIALRIVCCMNAARMLYKLYPLRRKLADKIHLCQTRAANKPSDTSMHREAFA